MDGQGGDGRLPGLGYVNQINVIAILTLVQGGLLLIMGIACIGYGVLFANIQQFQPPGGGNAAPPPAVQQVMFWYMIGLASVSLVLATMHFIAGAMAFKFKGRVFSIVTFIGGLASLLTCYCGLTAIGLCIYGMIIYLNPAVAKAFEMAAGGMTKDEILKKFY
jgi:hypothetical protein